MKTLPPPEGSKKLSGGNSLDYNLNIQIIKKIEKKEPMNKEIIKITIFVSIAVVAILIFIKQESHKKVTNGENTDTKNACKKEIIGAEGEYDINLSDLPNKLFFKIGNFNKKEWNYLLKPLNEAEVKKGMTFNTCMANITKYPAYLLSAKLPKEVVDKVKRSTGLVVYLETKTLFQNKPIANITLNMELLAYKGNKETYNLAEAMDYLVESYKLVKESSDIFRLVYTGDIGSNISNRNKFSYDFVQLNGSDLENQRNVVEFVSHDNGKTWEGEPVKK